MTDKSPFQDKLSLSLLSTFVILSVLGIAFGVPTIIKNGILLVLH